MIGRLLTTGCVAAALALSPAERAEADAGEFIGGAIIGGIIGYAAGQNQGQQRTTTGTRVVRPGIPATQQGRETQTALNYFGYDAGAVDGQIGAGTRSAIERFQASMGYPVNGREFASYQFDFLMDGYFWATQQGGAQQTGLRGPQLLYAYRDSLSGAPIQSTAPVQQVQPPATTVIVNPPGQGNAPASTVVAAGNGQLPNLFANGEARMSLANACNAVMLQTSSNGGYLTLATMTDPSQRPVGAVLRRAHLRHGAGRGPDAPDHRADAGPDRAAMRVLLSDALGRNRPRLAGRDRAPDGRDAAIRRRDRHRAGRSGRDQPRLPLRGLHAGRHAHGRGLGA
jgi:hypothetical protein